MPQIPNRSRRRGRPPRSLTTTLWDEPTASPSRCSNTELAYAAGLRHYEEIYLGILPATTADIADYLTTYQGLLAISTLRQRVWALSRYHREHGFSDPTAAPEIAYLLTRIGNQFQQTVKQARPITRRDLEQACLCCEREIQLAASAPDHRHQYRPLRDRALLLIGFWLGMRADHLARLTVDSAILETLPSGRRLTLYLPTAESADENIGPWYLHEMPAYCPITAYLDWVRQAMLTTGPLFRRIDAGYHLHDEQLHSGSINGILRRMLSRAGLPGQEYSSHSLRRGLVLCWLEVGGSVDALVDHLNWKCDATALRYRSDITSLQQALFQRWERDRSGHR